MAQFGFHTTSDEAATALRDAITGKTILVTGVSPNSLGSDTARAIVAQKPAKLLLASRSAHKLEEVIASLDIPQGTTVQPIELDLSSLEATRKAAAEIRDSVSVLDAVICTAGVMATPSYEKSKDGIELQFAVNHLGHFLLINLLIEKLLASEHATVVMYTSEAQSRANLDFLDDLSYNEGKAYEKWTAYSNSKACNVLFAVGLAKRFGEAGLRSFSVDPGVIVSTGLTRSVPMEDFKTLGWVDDNGNLNSAIKAKSLAEGASTAIIAAFDHRLTNKDGYYLADGVLTKEGVLPGALDPAVADKLWKVSEDLTKQAA
ncbi:NAD(P)-binding protein [Trichoderma citrinoviride]|uniref:NAD(P)-binding protein n=1 Tax=Trichoderma citrinoviride TaxID=58853 RepID=A0A2T4BN18_9HYPO|nr:NAD(P)-binding protein [Trichoderma citrinoviride]PTB70707.1 NAD(P)-binding protein [Trichoderma citrinoviride]